MPKIELEIVDQTVVARLSVAGEQWGRIYPYGPGKLIGSLREAVNEATRRATAKLEELGIAQD